MSCIGSSDCSGTEAIACLSTASCWVEGGAGYGEAAAWGAGLP